MAEAYIVDAVRSPGRAGAAAGSRRSTPPTSGRTRSRRWSSARASTPPRSRTSCSAASTPSAAQAGDIARTCWLAAGLPEHVPGTTVDRQCGSSQQAMHFAAQAVMSGTMDVVVAGGVQQMSQIPISSAMLVGQQFGFDDPFSGSEGWVARYGTQEVSQFRSAEMIAEKWDISREDMEAFAVESHERAIRARAEGRFDAEIVPLGGVTADEGPREPNWDKIRSLPTLTEGGRVTAAVRLADLRRVGRPADRQRAGPRRPRAHAAGPHPPPVGAGRRPGVDAHRARSRPPRTRWRRPA